MKNKCIAFVLSVVFCISLISTNVFADAKFFKMENTDKIRFLNSVGIHDFRTGDEEKIVTREIFAVALSDLLDNFYHTSEERYFIDLEINAYSLHAVNSLVDSGIISVGDDRLFRPNDFIEYSEAIKMVVCALGGREYAEAMGGYPGGYFEIARKLGLSFTPKDYKKITMSEAADLLYKVAVAHTIETNIISNRGNSYQETDETLLYKHKSIMISTGAVEGAYGFSIYSGLNISEQDEIIISGKKYYFDNKTVNILDLIGSRVDFAYYVENNTDEVNKIVYIKKAANSYDIEFSVDDYISYDGNKIKYHEKDKSVTEYIYSPVVVYNGRELTADVSNTLAKLNKGIIKVTDMDADGKYDAILVFDYENIYVGAKTENGAYNKLNNSSFVELDDLDFVNVFNSESELISFSDIKVGDVLSAAFSKDRKSVILYIENNQISGVLNSKANFGDKLIVTIDDTEYTVEKSYAESFDDYTDMGCEYTYCFDHLGNISYVFGDLSAGKNIGYIVDIKPNESSLSKNMSLLMLKADGKLEEIEFADRYLIDGDYRKSKNNQQTCNEIKAIKDDCLVAYTLDSNGRIRKIDTPNVNSDYESEKNSLTALFDNTNVQKFFRTNELGRLAMVTNDTLTFYVPYNMTGKELEKDYIVGKTSTYLLGDQSYYSNAYKFNIESGYCDAVLVKYTDSSNQLSVNNYLNVRGMVFSELINALNDDGEAKTFAIFYKNAKEVQYEVADNVSFEGIEPGDIVSVIRDIQGRIISKTLIYDCSKTIDEQKDSSHWNTHSAFGWKLYEMPSSTTSKGYVHVRQFSYGNAVSLTSDKILRVAASDDMKVTEAIKVAGNITVVEKIRNKITVRSGKITDILTYENAGGYCSKIIYLSSDGSYVGMVIYNI